MSRSPAGWNAGVTKNTYVSVIEQDAFAVYVVVTTVFETIVVEILVSISLYSSSGSCTIWGDCFSQVNTYVTVAVAL